MARPIIRDFVAVSVYAKNVCAVRLHELIMEGVGQNVTASALPIVPDIQKLSSWKLQDQLKLDCFPSVEAGKVMWPVNAHCRPTRFEFFRHLLEIFLCIEHALTALKQKPERFSGFSENTLGSSSGGPFASITISSEENVLHINAHSTKSPLLLSGSSRPDSY